MRHPTPLPDLTEEQRQELQTRIQCCLGSQIRHFRLVVRDGEFVLQGRAETYHAKQHAQEIASTVTGRESLVNDIQIA